VVGGEGEEGRGKWTGNPVVVASSCIAIAYFDVGSMYEESRAKQGKAEQGGAEHRRLLLLLLLKQQHTITLTLTHTHTHTLLTAAVQAS